MSSSGPKTKIRRLSEAKTDAELCTACPYSAVRRAPVFGSGAALSPIIFVGDVARESDDVDQRAFAGRAGRKLDNLLEEAEINPKKVYRTFAVKCFPGRQPRFPNEKAATRCQTHLIKQFKAMTPIAVVLCGGRVLNWLLLRWSTRPLADEQFFNSWVGPAIVMREIWGPIRFFVIHNPARLARLRSPEDEERTIETLSFIKSYVTARLTGGAIVPDTIELQRQRVTQQNQTTFGWTLQDAKEQSED